MTGARGVSLGAGRDGRRGDTPVTQDALELARGLQVAGSRKTVRDDRRLERDDGTGRGQGVGDLGRQVQGHPVLARGRGGLTVRTVVDSHVHHWDPERLAYPWLDEFTRLRRPYLPAHLAADAAGLGVAGVVHVQADCRPDQALAYLRRAILNGNVSRWRRHRGAELVVAEPPEQPYRAGLSAVDDRLTLLPLVRDLPPKQRAVLVLRYLCDLGDAEIAETLGIGTSTVRTQAMRALASLRAAHPDPDRQLVPATEEIR